MEMGPRASPQQAPPYPSFWKVAMVPSLLPETGMAGSATVSSSGRRLSQSFLGTVKPSGPSSFSRSGAILSFDFFCVFSTPSYGTVVASPNHARGLVARGPKRRAGRVLGLSPPPA